MNRRALLPRRAVLGAALLTPAMARGQEAVLRFAALYSSWGVRGLVFSDQVKQLSGQRVGMLGYMAPPLRAESRFFVLTSEPLALCPFCQSDAEWPIDIVVVYLRHEMPLVDAGSRVRVQGRLEAGSWTDPDSGFVSLLRLVDADYRTA